jgi:hypothetical protein
MGRYVIKGLLNILKAQSGIWLRFFVFGRYQKGHAFRY